MQAKKIFKVKIDDVNAELEIKDSLHCIVGDTVIFDILISDIRAFEFQKPNKIALNFYKNDQLMFIKFSSKFAIEISEIIKSLTD